MPEWETHRRWAKRFLEWGDLDHSDENLEHLVDFPQVSGFVPVETHDFNRRIWRDAGNRNHIHNAFGEMGDLIMDLHYCLDFLKEETDRKVFMQKWKLTFPGIDEKEIEIYPSIIELARYLASKVRDLDINMRVFKFVIVNFREIMAQLVREHGYDPGRLRDWDNSNFNRLIEELDSVR